MSSTPTLPQELLDAGWSADVYDLCWQACPKRGFRKEAGNMEICLCRRHIEAMSKDEQALGSVYIKHAYQWQYLEGREPQKAPRSLERKPLWTTAR